MAYALRFQVLLLPNLPWPEFRQRYLRLEELGFDLVGTADHLVDWTNPPIPGLNSGLNWPLSPQRPRAFGCRPW